MSLVILVTGRFSFYLGTFGDILQYPGYPVERCVAQIVPRRQHPLALDAMVGLGLGVLHGVHF